MSGPPQACGEAILEGVLLTSATPRARLVLSGGVLEEVDCVLEYLSFLHPVLSLTLQEKQQQ